jgi:hypothetical protein
MVNGGLQLGIKDPQGEPGETWWTWSVEVLPTEVCSLLTGKE